MSDGKGPAPPGNDVGEDERALARGCHGPIFMAMNTMRKIEVDESTASALERQAADRGVSVADLVAELAELAADPITLSEADLAELDRIALEADQPGGTVPHEDVALWLETWGTADYKPWGGR